MDVVRRYGWKPDLPDPRDRRLRVARVPAAKLPPRVSLRAKMPPVYDQLALGSCTAQSVCGLFHYHELTDANPRLLVPSRLFTYYNTRRIEETTPFDAGASIRNTVKSLIRYGVCPETDWPYDPDRFARRPPKACYTKALPMRVTSYGRVEQTLDALRGCLAGGTPVAFGFSIHASFEKPGVDAAGVMPLPAADEAVLGGHAVLAVGYDDARGAFEVRNSWGDRWGDAGHFWMPYALVCDDKTSADFWAFGEVS